MGKIYSDFSRLDEQILLVSFSASIPAIEQCDPCFKKKIVAMYMRAYHEKRQDHISVNCPECTLFIVYLKVDEL